ncbi:hypothetical protein [Agrobacterium tumefaciens]|uniref:hypothetical protein n=1 Tax=Agrobacterium tumefaciens TaxID=358 RepID=UPI003BA29D7D
MPKKPTGQQGFYRVEVQADGVSTGTFMREFLGDEKEKIESAVADKFVEAWAAMGVPVSALPNRKENDLDFTLETPGGSVKLELTELIFPAPAKGSPYREGEAFTSTFGEAADRLVATIAHKAKHYTVGTQPIQLLVYATHEVFAPVEEVIRLVQYRLANGVLKHPFESIFFLEDLPVGPVVRCLYPVPAQCFEGLDPMTEEARVYARLAPDGWK